jgi:hypothetical protein
MIIDMLTCKEEAVGVARVHLVSGVEDATARGAHR